MRPFHYAFKVKDLASTKQFYVDVLGCKQGRSSENWLDFDFFGHQLSAHLSADLPEPDYCGKVDGVSVPIPHFGCILSIAEFEGLAKRLEKHQVTFVVPPQVRYEGKVGEQKTMFFLDYSGNPIEIKAFKNEDELYQMS